MSLCAPNPDAWRTLHPGSGFCAGSAGQKDFRDRLYLEFIIFLSFLITPVATFYNHPPVCPWQGHPREMHLPSDAGECQRQWPARIAAARAGMIGPAFLAEIE